MDKSLLLAFLALKNKGNRLLSPIPQVVGLTSLQAGVLFYLSIASQDVTVGDVSELTFVDPANASTLCKKLEREGYLTRTRHSADRRVVTLSLTEKGREATERLQILIGHYLELIAGAPAPLRESFYRGFAAIDEMLDYLNDQTKGDQKPC